MSYNKNNGKLNLKLNLSLLPRGEPSTLMRMETDSDEEEDEESPNRMSTSSSSGQSMTPPSSCVSSENSPVSKSMVLAGCPRCLMYVMLSEDEEPKCPKCKNPVLIDFNRDDNKQNKNKSKNGNC